MIDEAGKDHPLRQLERNRGLGQCRGKILPKQVESPRWYVPRLVVHAKWAGHAQREQPKVTRGRRRVSQKVAVAEVGGCRRTRS
jgi:hypothetical protein